jgi:sulfur carrier protein ThiS
MTNKRDEKKRKIDHSYFAVSRRKRRKIMIKVLSIGSAVIAAFIAMVILTDASITTHNDKLLVMHIHPLLNVVINGKSITVPKNIGIDSLLHKDHSLDQYGTDGAAPLHTHDDTGTIHVESTANRNYTLGEFLNIWGIDLKGKTVKVSVDGTVISDHVNHILEDGQNLDLYIT